MDFSAMVDPGVPAGDAVTVVVAVIFKILAFGAMGVVVVGIVVTCMCDLLECRKWRRCQGRTEFWGLMH